MPLDRGVSRGNDVQPVTTGLGDSQQLFKGPQLILNMLENLVRDDEIKRGCPQEAASRSNRVPTLICSRSVAE